MTLPPPQLVVTAAQFEEALALRLRVFCDEQGVPREIERDEADAFATHVVVRDRKGAVSGTGRVLRERADGTLAGLDAPARPGDRARIGRMAVRRDRRAGGLGSVVLQALEAAARRAGLREATLHAQLVAEGFYLRHGYARAGAEFREAGIPHVVMAKTLRSDGDA